MEVLGEESSTEFRVDHFNGVFIIEVKLVAEGQMGVREDGVMSKS